MSKPEWGTKRVCQSCGAKFYDFGRAPIACPKCSAIFDPDVLLKSRRPRAAAPIKPSKPPEKVAVADDEIEIEDDDEALAKLPDNEDEDEAVIEDASELAEDEEEMSKVVGPGGSEEA